MTLAWTGCSDPAVGPQAKPQSEAEPAPRTDPAEPEPEPRTKPDPRAPVATELGVVALTLDGVARRLEVREPEQATINRLSHPPAMAVIARGPGESSEMLILKIGGVDLDRATLPLELTTEDGASLSFTYVDESGGRHVERSESATSNRLTVEAWEPTQRRLRASFAATLEARENAPAQLLGTFEIELHDPFDR